MGLKSKQNITLKPNFEKTPAKTTTSVEENVELDIIQRLRNNLETLQKSQERVEYLNKELGGVLNFKNS